MAIKLPPQYPPELSAKLASKIIEGSGKDEFKSAVLFGPDMPAELIEKIRSRKYTLEIGKQNEVVGMSILDLDKKGCAITFACDIEESDDAIESMAIALHAFKHLKVEKVTLIDGVNLVEESGNELYRIDDHINMTGMNPLQYWMLPDEPDPFFLDVREMYKSNGPDDLEGIVHFASFETDLGKLTMEVSKASAGSYGRAFLPESILAKYLGFDVAAIGYNLNIQKSDESKLITRLLDIIS